MSKTTNNSNSKVIEAKFMWMDKNGELHYISKDQFNKAIDIAEKVVDIGIKGCVFSIASTATAPFLIAAAPASGNPVMNGLQPLFTTIGHFAQPVCYGYLMKGMFNMMQAKEEEGKKTMKFAVGGFLGAKFVPQIFDFLETLQLFS